MHKFDQDFYGSTLKVCMLGYLRPEMDFKSLGWSQVFLQAKKFYPNFHFSYTINFCSSNLFIFPGTKFINNFLLMIKIELNKFLNK